MLTISIHINATVNASLDKTWLYYTTPEHIMNWNFASPDWHCPTVTNDLRVGGKYCATMAAKDGSSSFEYTGYYTAIVPGKEYTLMLDDGRDVDVVFEAKAEGTLVTITFETENENSIDMQRAGWQAILDNFKQYTETN